MKKRYLFLGLFILLFILSSCSSSSNDSENAKSDYGISNQSQESAQENNMDYNENSDSDDSEESENLTEMDEIDTAQSDRMIIHRANLAVKVKNLEESRVKIEKRTKKYGGYIVESNIYKDNDEHNSGYITIRIPEENFQDFLKDTETEVAEIIERNISGQDITEEYVDLESRLKSKRVVEERLLTFMKETKKTEDLLIISSDLANVQEEIEVVTGKMKFFDNQVAFSTIEISMYESGVKVPDLENKNLDTWEKTKKQLATSINFILSAGSGVFIFTVGNLPIILLLLVIGTIVFISIKRKQPPKQ